MRFFDRLRGRKKQSAAAAPKAGAEIQRSVDIAVLVEQLPGIMIPQTHAAVVEAQPISYVEEHRFQISSNGRHVAYVVEIRKRDSYNAEQGDGQFYDYEIGERDGFLVVADGNRGAVYDSVEDLEIDDSGVVRYLAVKGGANPVDVYVTDETERELPSMVGGSFSLSPERGRYAYLRYLTDGMSVVVDGEEGAAYERILGNFAGGEDVEGDWISYGILFSPDEQRIAYLVAKGDKQVLVIDDHETEPYDRIAYPRLFSPDSKRTAFHARNGDRWFFVVDGKVEAEFDYIADFPVWSSDSRRVAYKAQRGHTQESAGRWCVVCDGVKGPLYRGVEEPIFSDDGTVFAYEVWNGDAERDEGFVVVDGTPGPIYDRVDSLQFIPGTTTVAYVAQRGGQQMLVIEGAEQRSWNGVDSTSLHFAYKGKRYGYVANQSDRYIAVIDGQPQKGKGDARDDIVFSPDGRRFAYVDCKGTHCAVVDGVAHKRFGIVSRRIRFSEDGAHVAYHVRRDAQDFIVVDGAEGRQFDLILRFLGPDHEMTEFLWERSALNYIAIDGKRLVRVAENLASD